MEGSNANTNKKKVEAQGEGESSTKKLKVTMGVETLDCPICYEPLTPPIFQCLVGHCICSSCREKLDKKCAVCSIKTSFKRCFAMEHVVQEAKVACSNEKYGCVEGVIYYQKEEHKKACPNAPCSCTESGCGFTGPTKVLLDHFIIQHKCLSTILPDSGTVSLRLQTGLHVLRCTETSYFFLLNMSSEPLGYAISVIRVQPNVTEPKFKCNMEYDCITTGCRESINCHIRSSSLSDGLPIVYDLIIPKGKERVRLLIFNERPVLKLLDDDDDDDDEMMILAHRRYRPRHHRRRLHRHHQRPNKEEKEKEEEDEDEDGDEGEDDKDERA
ncbi:E3 ubiquitin-protein ligase SINA-like 7 [Triticum dicoccoides]|uniref:E3 ubiquitin-protein ligase SINA-like 7 n=1 Tax=Triticum dicoccoides TaxID=85692 RepID=UPI0018906360|nr:E3 ubiquitin-protein ligase SINA-like 7 [Triticum dicoccoides]